MCLSIAVRFIRSFCFTLSLFCAIFAIRLINLRWESLWLSHDVFIPLHSVRWRRWFKMLWIESVSLLFWFASGNNRYLSAKVFSNRTHNSFSHCLFLLLGMVSLSHSIQMNVYVIFTEPMYVISLLCFSCALRSISTEIIRWVGKYDGFSSWFSFSCIIFRVFRLEFSSTAQLKKSRSHREFFFRVRRLHATRIGRSELGVVTAND